MRDCLLILIAPSIVAGLIATNISSNSIAFEWYTGAGRSDGFDIIFSDLDATSCEYGVVTTIF